ncbi:hypothetical protein EGM70_03155 [Enterobacteriaceae bacterium 89]|nr:hypothetical protein [Enterobacteriaceae bacterium 89]
MMDPFCAAKEPVGCGVHNLVVPLSFRCIYSFISPSCYLSDGALTRHEVRKAFSLWPIFRRAATKDQLTVQQARSAADILTTELIEQ